MSIFKQLNMLSQWIRVGWS